MQGAWFAAALLASTPSHLLGAAANAVVLAVHLATSGAIRRELLRAAAALTLGLFIELTQQYVGGLQVRPAGALPPLWLLSLWPVFASAMMEGHSLSWLAPRPLVAAALGAVLGPLSYAGGGRLGALHFEGARTVITIALCWALAMTVLATLARSLSEERAPTIAAR